MFKECIRYLFYVLEIYTLYAIEQTPEVNLMKMPLFWIISGFVCVALFEKEFTSMAFGILAGFLIDLSFGSFLGFNALILGVLGYILGVLFSYFIRTNFFSAMLIAGVISILILVLNTCVNFSIFELKSKDILTDFVWISSLNAVITLPIYFINRTISYMMREKRNENIKF